MNKNPTRANEAEFESCDGTGKWTPGCQRHHKTLADSAAQSKLIIYGVPAQGYQQLQQQVQQNLQYQYHHHHLHHQLHDEHHLPLTPQLSLSSTGQKRSCSSEALNDLPIDECLQQFPKKFEIYDKPLPCYNSFCSWTVLYCLQPRASFHFYCYKIQLQAKFTFRLELFS